MWSLLLLIAQNAHTVKSTGLNAPMWKLQSVEALPRATSRLLNSGAVGWKKRCKRYVTTLPRP